MIYLVSTVLVLWWIYIINDTWNIIQEDKNSEKTPWSELEKKKDHLDSKILTLKEQVEAHKNYLETLKQKLYNESGIPPSRTTTSPINPTGFYPLHDRNDYFKRTD